MTVVPEDRAALLVEALPYIRQFHDAVVVVKYGGNALAGAGVPGTEGEGAPGAEGEGEGAGVPGTEGEGAGGAGEPAAAAGMDGPGAERAALASFAQDVVLLQSVGLRPVVVHGGGPQIGDLLGRLGMETEFRNGQRVTDAATLDVVRMVLVGKVNRDIVSAVNVHGPLAVGLSGEDANLITATAHTANLGYVGTVAQVDATIVRRLLSERLIPVLATIGADAAGQAYNINADTVAGAVAEALGAEKLIFLTDVQGLRADPADESSLMHRVSAVELEGMVASGAAAGGMVPKAEACIRAVRNGVQRAHILDGRVPHALLLELFTDAGVGTMVLP